jgi:hypothetical protein
MATFTEIRIARKRHVACTCCQRPIEPGQKYELFTATPGDEIWNAPRWSRMKAHHPYGSCLHVTTPSREARA